MLRPRTEKFLSAGEVEKDPEHYSVSAPKAMGASFPWAGLPGATRLFVYHQLTEGKMMERRKKIALELSELVVYCRPVPFDEESKSYGQGWLLGKWRGPGGTGVLHSWCEMMILVPSTNTWEAGSVCVLPVWPEIGTERACYRDMSSFPETKAEKYVNKAKGKKFLQYNRLQLSRIYPKGQRLDSSNYDPLPMWICGSQLVALNFQTPGEEVPVSSWEGGWEPRVVGLECM